MKTLSKVLFLLSLFTLNSLLASEAPQEEAADDPSEEFSCETVKVTVSDDSKSATVSCGGNVYLFSGDNPVRVNNVSIRVLESSMPNRELKERPDPGQKAGH